MVYYGGINMFDVFFENTFSNCIGSTRNICILLKDDISDNLTDVWSLTMNTIAPQRSVSVFEFNALDGKMDEEIVSTMMLERIRNFTSTSALDENRKPISNIYFTAGILEESILVIYNAENLSDEFYQSIEKIERALRVSGKGRLRVLLIGSESLIPMVARNTTGFNKVKWFNALNNPQRSAEMLESIAMMATNENDDSHKAIQNEAEKDLIVFGVVV